MLHIVKSPGSCGELLQGSMDGQDFLVTCPINLYSYAVSGHNLKRRLRHEAGSGNGIDSKDAGIMSDLQHILQNHLPKELGVFLLTEKTHKLQRKSLHAARMLGITDHEMEDIVSFSQLLQGKGLASSSADISSVAMAASLLKGHSLTYEELAKLCLSIEPTDASFYPGSVQFDYYKGKVTRYLGQLPAMKLVVFDEGGTIDTVAFNQQADLKEKVSRKEPVVKEAFQLLLEGFETGSGALLGRAATMSALANQDILYKKHLPALIDIGRDAGSFGVVVAHSGTVMALLFPKTYETEHLKKEVIPSVIQTCEGLSYLYTVNTINTGITYVTIKE